MRAGRFKMRWTVDGKTFETVAQYLHVVQHNAFTAVAAGVVVHQHTRMLMADLRECADGMPVEDVRAGLSQLLAEFGATYSTRPQELEGKNCGRWLRSLRAGQRGGRRSRGEWLRETIGSQRRSAAAQCVRGHQRKFEGNRSWRRRNNPEMQRQYVHVVERQAAEMGCSGGGGAHSLQQSKKRRHSY